jgi:hypothetical protein
VVVVDLINRSLQAAPRNRASATPPNHATTKINPLLPLKGGSDPP